MLKPTADAFGGIRKAVFQTACRRRARRQRRLEYTPEAIRDIQSMSDYISDTLYNPVAAKRIKQNILKACALLKRQPLMGKSVQERTGHETELRYLVCEKHLIFYKAEEDVICAARIINSKMDYISILFDD
jgi:plasmid stabilization system protein ParE